MPARFLVVLLAACALAQSTTAIDNDEVHVIVAHQRPHARTALHEHKFNRVMIYLQAGSQTFTFPGKPPASMSFKSGEVQWSPAGGMHTAEITSPNPVTIVEVELKKDGAGRSPAGPLDPVAVDPAHYKVEFENPQVRVLRVKIGPHQSTPQHKHSLNRVVAYLTDQDIRITSDGGKVERTQHKAGDVAFAGPAEHREENLSDRPFEVVVVELK